MARFRVDSDVLEKGSPQFGDISYIAPLEDASMTIRMPLEGAIDYATLHSRDIKESVLRVKSNASGGFPSGKSLSDAVSTRGLNCDLPTYVLPRP